MASVRLVPFTDDAPALWDTWMAMGGEGMRSPAWLKLKPKLTLTITISGGSAERIGWGDWARPC